MPAKHKLPLWSEVNQDIKLFLSCKERTKKPYKSPVLSKAECVADSFPGTGIGPDPLMGSVNDMQPCPVQALKVGCQGAGGGALGEFVRPDCNSCGTWLLKVSATSLHSAMG